MDTSSDELHGILRTSSLKSVVRHEAGHALLFWLLDQNILSVYATEQGGMTERILMGKDNLTLPSQHLLYLLAGMVMSCDKKTLFDLREHVDNPEHFDVESDSFKAAMLSQAFKTPLLAVFIHHEVVLYRLKNRFRKAYNEIVDLLLQRDDHMLDLEDLYGMQNRWDVEFGFDKRPKSDFVMRALARECKWNVPKCKWLGWDMKPLEKWEYKRPTLIELAKRLKEELERSDS